MRSAKLNFFLIFFMAFGLACQGYADCSPLVESNTTLEAGGKKGWEGFLKIISLGTAGSFEVDEKLYQYITVRQVKDQGIDGYFNPKIQVCDYEGGNCYILPSGTSCRQIYGTQASGAGVSAAVFIDWEGNKTSVNAKIADSLEWEWADNVTDEEKTKFAKSPKICACSQKGACMSGGSEWFSRVVQGENIFRPGDIENVCDTCSSWSKGKQKIKCAPVLLAPGPPPLCKQLAMSPPQVRIVPITNEDNDYFNPRVGVMISGLERKYLDFQETSHEVEDGKGTTYYFETYRKKDQLCAEYHGTEKSNKKLQFPPRYFPAPPAPEPEVVEIVRSNASGKQSDTLKIRMKMSKSTCTKAHGTYSNLSCTFNVNTNYPTNIGPLSLKVVKPAIVAKTTNSSDSKGDIDNIIESILKNNSQFEILKEYGYVPDIETECKELKEGKCKLDNLGQPKIEIKYKENDKSKMLCLSGWQPEPEEFVFKRGNEIIPLKLMGTKYIKYNAVYSKESNRFYYLPSKEKEIADLLKRPQSRLDEIIFNKLGYVFFPDENKQEKGKCSYCVDESKGEKIDEYFDSGKVKVVYKLTDVEHKEECKQGDDCCICFDGTHRCSAQYLNKKDGNPFCLRYEEVDCKDDKGNILRNKKGEIQKCTQLKDQPIKANRTEVFYADKLCMFDLEGIKERVLSIIKERSKGKNVLKPYEFSGDNNYTDDLSKYGYIEIEAWGGGEAGHIQGTPSGCKDTNCSTENRPGMPGDYIKAKLKIDPNCPIIKAEVTEGGGGLTSHISNKDGGPTFIKMCKDSSEAICKDLITVAGGGVYKKYGGGEYKETKVHGNVGKLQVLGNPTIVTGKASTQDNQIAYIENGEIKHEAVECSSTISNKHGAGGCIDKSRGIYSRGSPGYVKISSVKIDYEEIEKIINDLVADPNSTVNVSGLIQELYPNIIDDIREEIKKKLLGL